MTLYGYPFVIEDKQRVKPTDPRLTSQREITFLSVKVVYFHSKPQNTHSQQLRTVITGIWNMIQVNKNKVHVWCIIKLHQKVTFSSDIVYL